MNKKKFAGAIAGSMLSMAMVAGTTPAVALADESIEDTIAGAQEAITNAIYGIEIPTVTISPKAIAADIPGELGSTARIYCTTVGMGDQDLTYQWQVSKDSGKTWENSTAASATTQTLYKNITAANMALRFKCIVTAADGTTAESNTVRIYSTFSAVATAKPTMEGDTCKIHCTVIGNGNYTATYQWYTSKDKGNTWKKCTAKAATTATLSLKATQARKGRMFRCNVTAATITTKSNAACMVVY